jgi:hypothetical protein
VWSEEWGWGVMAGRLLLLLLLLLLGDGWID